MTDWDDKPYVFPNNTPQKSSSSVLTKNGESVACPTCGCRTQKDGTILRTFAKQRKKCTCICHR
jgi:hypothetical protein